MEENRSQTPLSFVKKPASRTPLTFDKEEEVASRAPLTFGEKPNPVSPSPTPQDSRGWGSAATPSVASEPSVADALTKAIAAAAFYLQAPSVQTRFGAFNVAFLRNLAPNASDPTALDAALSVAFQALRELAARLDATKNDALTEANARIEAALCTANAALRENFYRQAENALRVAEQRLRGERFVLARLTEAALCCRSGRLADALATLCAVAETKRTPPEDGASPARWAVWRTILETRDLASKCFGRPLLTDFWRAREDFFRSWAEARVPEPEREQALELARAAALFPTDLEAAERAARTAAFGKSKELNEAATELYATSFGVAPKRNQGKMGRASVLTALGAAGVSFGGMLACGIGARGRVEATLIPALAFIIALAGFAVALNWGKSRRCKSFWASCAALGGFGIFAFCGMLFGWGLGPEDWVIAFAVALSGLGVALGLALQELKGWRRQAFWATCWTLVGVGIFAFFMTFADSEDWLLISAVALSGLVVALGLALEELKGWRRLPFWASCAALVGVGIFAFFMSADYEVWYGAWFCTPAVAASGLAVALGLALQELKGWRRLPFWATCWTLVGVGIFAFFMSADYEVWYGAWVCTPAVAASGLAVAASGLAVALGLAKKRA